MLMLANADTEKSAAMIHAQTTSIAGAAVMRSVGFYQLTCPAEANAARRCLRLQQASLRRDPATVFESKDSISTKLDDLKSLPTSDLDAFGV